MHEVIPPHFEGVVVISAHLFRLPAVTIYHPTVSSRVGGEYKRVSYTKPNLYICQTGCFLVTVHSSRSSMARMLREAEL